MLIRGRRPVVGTRAPWPRKPVPRPLCPYQYVLEAGQEERPERVPLAEPVLVGLVSRIVAVVGRLVPTAVAMLSHVAAPVPLLDVPVGGQGRLLTARIAIAIDIAIATAIDVSVSWRRTLAPAVIRIRLDIVGPFLNVAVTSGRGIPEQGGGGRLRVALVVARGLGRLALGGPPPRPDSEGERHTPNPPKTHGAGGPGRRSSKAKKLATRRVW